MDRLWEELGVRATLAKGHDGIFTVSVNGLVVAEKGMAGYLSGFPDEEEIVRAVEIALRASEYG